MVSDCIHILSHYIASNGSSECFYSRPSAVLIEDTGLGSAV